ncbi:hypothetical protein J3U35_05600, partial [Gilliamella sp. B2717]|uniref:hypothetical protein n=1 Tax=Gilliamella sp. B2717 TaxID=2817996 RepID=UPI00226A7BBB
LMTLSSLSTGHPGLIHTHTSIYQISSGCLSLSVGKQNQPSIPCSYSPLHCCFCAPLTSWQNQTVPASLSLH